MSDDTVRWSIDDRDSTLLETTLERRSHSIGLATGTSTVGGRQTQSLADSDGFSALFTLNTMLNITSHISNAHGEDFLPEIGISGLSDFPSLDNGADATPSLIPAASTSLSPSSLPITEDSLASMMDRYSTIPSRRSPSLLPLPLQSNSSLDTISRHTASFSSLDFPVSGLSAEQIPENPNRSLHTSALLASSTLEDGPRTPSTTLLSPNVMAFHDPFSIPIRQDRALENQAESPDALWLPPTSIPRSQPNFSWYQPHPRDPAVELVLASNIHRFAPSGQAQPARGNSLSRSSPVIRTESIVSEESLPSKLRTRPSNRTRIATPRCADSDQILKSNSDLKPTTTVLLHTVFGSTLQDPPIITCEAESTGDQEPATSEEDSTESPAQPDTLHSAHIFESHPVHPVMQEGRLGYLRIRTFLGRMVSSLVLRKGKKRSHKAQSKHRSDSGNFAPECSPGSMASREAPVLYSGGPPTDEDWIAFGRFACSSLDSVVKVSGNHSLLSIVEHDAHNTLSLSQHRPSVLYRPPHWQYALLSGPIINHSAAAYVLNPRLQAPAYGMHHLSWDIRHHPVAVCSSLGTSGLSVVPPCTFKEPVTWPLCSELQITNLAGDTRHPWPWPFTIRNPTGVLLEDLLRAVHQSFSQALWPHEWALLSDMRRQAVERTWALRLAEREREKASKVLGNQTVSEELGDEILRVDYLLGHPSFHGIQSDAEGGGWTLYLGAL